MMRSHVKQKTLNVHTLISLAILCHRLVYYLSFMVYLQQYSTLRILWCHLSFTVNL